MPQAQHLPANLPSTLHKLFDNPPVFETEDITVYHALLDAIAKDVNPADVLEWIWLRDIVDLTWEILRLRRWKTLFIELARNERSDRIGLETLKAEFRATSPNVVGDFVRTEKGLVKFDDHIESRLSVDEEFLCHKEDLSPRFDSEEDHAQAFLDLIDEHSKMDAMICSAESRRNNALRELEVHREILATRLRRVSDRLIEANAKVVSSNNNSQPVLANEDCNN